MIIGPVRLERELGRGANGIVYAARTSAGKRVALKVITSPAGSAWQEALRGVRIGSPHVARVLDAGVDGGRAWLMMERLRGIDGRTLQRRAARVGRSSLHPTLAATIASQAGRGHAAAHAIGIVHRDVKPANLFVDDRGIRPCVKVLDFGVAQDPGASGTMLVGTPLYMAPEAITRPSSVDARADVFGLALTLRELLMGGPADGLSALTVLALRAHESPAPMSSQRLPVPSGLSAAVDRALVFDPDRRTPTMQAFVEEISPFVRDDALLELRPLLSWDEDCDPLADTMAAPQVA